MFFRKTITNVAILSMGLVLCGDALAPWQNFSTAAEPVPAAVNPQVRVDRYGDPLPSQALARLGTTRFVHSIIECLAYSPDGKILASGGRDKTIVLWDAQSGRKINELARAPGEVRALTFSPDSKFLVAASHDEKKASGSNERKISKGELRLFNVATGKFLLQLTETKEPPASVAFSPDGKTIATGHFSNCIRLWEAQTGKQIRVWVGEDKPNEVSSVAFTLDGKMLAAIGPRGTIRFLDLSTGKEIKREQKPAGDLQAISFSPDGAILAAAGSNGLRLYRASTLVEIHRLEGHEGNVVSVAFFPDGKTLASAGADQTIRLWDVKSGKELRQLLRPKHTIYPTFQPSALVIVSPDGKTVASAEGCWRNVIRLWDAETGVIKPAPESHLTDLEQIGFLKDGETVVTIMPGFQVMIWPKGTGKDARPLQSPVVTRVESCRLCSDHSTLAVTTTEGMLLLLDLLSGRELARCFIGKTLKYVNVVSQDHTRAVLTHQDFSIEIWDLSARKAIQRFEPGAWSMGFSPDVRLFAVKHPKQNQIVVWDLDRKNEVCRCEGKGLGDYGLVFFSRRANDGPGKCKSNERGVGDSQREAAPPNPNATFGQLFFHGLFSRWQNAGRRER